MTIPTEPIGSIPRPHELIEAIARKGSDDPSVDPLYETASKPVEPSELVATVASVVGRTGVLVRE